MSSEVEQRSDENTATGEMDDYTTHAYYPLSLTHDPPENAADASEDQDKQVADAVAFWLCLGQWIWPLVVGILNPLPLQAYCIVFFIGNGLLVLLLRHHLSRQQRALHSADVFPSLLVFVVVAKRWVQGKVAMGLFDTLFIIGFLMLSVTSLRDLTCRYSILSASRLCPCFDTMEGEFFDRLEESEAYDEEQLQQQIERFSYLETLPRMHPVPSTLKPWQVKGLALTTIFLLYQMWTNFQFHLAQNQPNEVYIYSPAG